MVTGLPGQKGPSGTSGVNWGTVLEGCVCVWAGGVHGPGQGCRKNTQSSCTLFPAYNRHLMSLLHVGGAPGGRRRGRRHPRLSAYLTLPSGLCSSGLQLGLGPTSPR